MGPLASMPVWTLALIALAVGGAVVAMLHVLAVETSDRRARHDFKNEVVRTRNDYVRRLRVLYEGGDDEDANFEFVDDPVTGAPGAEARRAAGSRGR